MNVKGRRVISFSFQVRPPLNALTMPLRPAFLANAPSKKCSRGKQGRANECFIWYIQMDIGLRFCCKAITVRA
jgi:hypothetical protein